MKNFVRLIPYLLLNIVISAATILGVLYLWDRYSRQYDLPPACPTPVADATPLAAADPETVATSAAPTPTTELPLILRVDTVVGAGDLATEAIKIKMVSGNAISLSGWQITTDYLSEPYVFPEFTLAENGQVQVHTGAGTDSITDLYWGYSIPLWYTGTVIRILDAEGTERITYKVP